MVTMVGHYHCWGIMMSEQAIPTLDTFETAILHMIYADYDGTHEDFRIKSEIEEGYSLQLVTSEDYYRGVLKAKKPKNVLFISDFSNDDRIYTNDAGLLLKPPHEILHSEHEIAMGGYDSNEIKWLCYKRIQRPKGYFSSVFGDVIYYECHYRLILLEENFNDYITHIHAWSPKSNKFYPVVKKQSDVGHFTKSAQECTDSFIMCASLVEDSQCKYFFNVSITADMTLTFYVDCDAVKELFKIRDNPLTINDRRRPIIHWVSKHLRKKPVNVGFADIPEHLRGVTEFDFEGLQVKISSPHDKRAA